MNQFSVKETVLRGAVHEVIHRLKEGGKNIFAQGVEGSGNGFHRNGVFGRGVRRNVKNTICRVINRPNRYSLFIEGRFKQPARFPKLCPIFHNRSDLIVFCGCLPAQSGLLA